MSIFAQEYQNFEIIIVNDNSDYENSEVLKTFDFEKIKVINLNENKGQLGAFFEGLKVAQGEFVCMIDADDVLLPNYLKTLLYIHLNNSYALVCSSFGEINENNEITSLANQKQEKVDYKEIENLFNLKENFSIKRVKTPFALWAWNPSTSGMFRKSALDILKFYPDVNYWKTGADKVLFSFLDLVGSSCIIDSICYLYRHHGENNSQTTLLTGDKKYLNEKYVDKLINWNKKIRLDAIKMFIENKKELVEKYNKTNYLRMFLKIIFCINIKVCAKIIKTFAHRLIKL